MGEFFEDYDEIAGRIPNEILGGISIGISEGIFS